MLACSAAVLASEMMDLVDSQKADAVIISALPPLAAAVMASRRPALEAGKGSQPFFVWTSESARKFFSAGRLWDALDSR